MTSDNNSHAYELPGLPTREPVDAGRPAVSGAETGLSTRQEHEPADLSETPDEARSEDMSEPSANERDELSRKSLANVYCDPRRHTVSFLLDDATANTVIYAVRVLVADYEAHAREVRTVAATLPPDSYGALNRHAIAWRHERIAARLRLLETNYRDVVGEGRGGC